MDERFPYPAKEPTRKSRRQLSVWMLTDEIATLLSKHTQVSKTEIIHRAITDLAKRVALGSADESFQERVVELLGEQA